MLSDIAMHSRMNNDRGRAPEHPVAAGRNPAYCPGNLYAKGAGNGGGFRGAGAFDIKWRNLENDLGYLRVRTLELSLTLRTMGPSFYLRCVKNPEDDGTWTPVIESRGNTNER
jgi:hypothetical protein